MEIDITRFFKEADAFEFSHSIAEGGKNAGKETWQAALNEGASAPLLSTPEQLEALREYVKGFGAWSDEEISAWSEAECNALFIQLISGDMREAGLDSDPAETEWLKYEANENAAYNIYRSGSDVFYSLYN